MIILHRICTHYYYYYYYFLVPCLCAAAVVSTHLFLANDIHSTAVNFFIF